MLARGLHDRWSGNHAVIVRLNPVNHIPPNETPLQPELDPPLERPGRPYDPGDPGDPDQPNTPEPAIREPQYEPPKMMC